MNEMIGSIIATFTIVIFIVVFLWYLVKENNLKENTGNNPYIEHNRNNADKDHNGKKEYEDYYKRCILLSLGAVIKADGNIRDTELERVKSIINRYYQTETERENAIKLLYSFVNDPKNNKAGVLFRKISRTLSYVAKREIIMELLSVAYADDIYDIREQRMIVDIISYINIKREEFDSIYRIFIEKYTQGFYNDNSQSHNNNSQNKSQQENEKKEDSKQNTETVNDAYLILGVDHNISDAEIQKAYRTLVLKYHPDNFENLGDETIRQATETMKQINIAWKTVKSARGIK